MVPCSSCRKLTLVIQQLFSGLGSILGVGRFNDGVDRARLLAETAVDALGHVNIVTGSATRSVSTLFGFNCDGLGRADLFAYTSQHTCNPCRCASKVNVGGVLTASQSLQAMHRSSPEGYRLRACSPRNRGEMGPYIKR